MFSHVPVIAFFLDCLTLEDRNVTLPSNTSNILPTSAFQHSRRAKILW